MGTNVVEPQVAVAGAWRAVDIRQVLRRGLSHHQAGEWALALKCYQAVLALEPEQADALNLTGVLAHQMGDHALAVTLLEQAAAIDPRAPDFAINLGLARQAMGDLTPARAAFERAVLLRPAAPTPHLHLGTVRRLLGDLSGAVSAYDRALALEPGFAEAHATRGAALHSLGRFAEAERALRHAILLKPEFAEAHSDLGSLLQATDRSDEAIASYRTAIGLKPDLVEAYANLGTAYVAAGATDAGIAVYRQALAVVPSHYESLVNLGMALQGGSRFDEAVAVFEAAQVVRPAAKEPYIHLGAILLAANRLTDALTAFNQGLDRVGPDPDLLSGRAGVFRHLDRLPESIRDSRAALALTPHSARLETNLANTLHATGDQMAALTAARRAIALDAGMAEARLTIGNIQKALGQFEDAARSYTEALHLKPTLAEAAFNLGNLWRDCGRYALAVDAYDRSLAIDADYGDARWNRALALIGGGDLGRGFDEYEWRWRDGNQFKVPILPGGPLWRGEDVRGKRIMIWREQGLGDELLFLTMVPDLIAAGAQVVLVVSLRLVELARRAFPTAEVIGSEPGALDGLTYDWHAPVGSLARWLRRSRDRFQGTGAFLKPLASERAKWEVRLSQLGAGRKVGICWRSGLLTTTRSRHYAPWDAWLPVLRTPGITWVNLQYDQCDEELAEARGHGITIHRWEGEDLRNDLESVVGLLSALDGAVTAPTAVSSLAGAVGTPTVQVDSGSDWTAFGEDRCPWMTSVRLVRKDDFEQGWGPVLERVSQELAEWSAGTRAL